MSTPVHAPAQARANTSPTPQTGALSRATREHEAAEPVPESVREAVRSGGQPLDAGTRKTMGARFGHDFSHIPLYPTQKAEMQTKLKVNQPGDIYEQGADGVAEQVMNTISKPPPVFKGESQTKNLLMRKQGRKPEIDTPGVPSAVQAVLSSSEGQPLDPTTRTFMEPRFNQDFSQVRVHTDELAATSARSINALAYTSGQNIVFGTGEYRPETIDGKRLLAHELAHVAQQKHAGENRTPGVNTAGDSFEATAQMMATLATNTQQETSTRNQYISPELLSLTNGRNPALIQRATPEEEKEAALDDLDATLINTFYSDPKNIDTDLIVGSKGFAVKLQEDFSSPKGMRTQLAAAQALLGMYKTLIERQKAAPRDEKDQSLLTKNVVGEPVPWTPEKPRQVEDIWPFTRENVTQWEVSVSRYRLSSMDQPVKKGSGSSTNKEASGTAVAEPETQVPPTLVGSALQSQETSLAERGSTNTGTPEINAGLAKLKNVTIGDADTAISARLNDIKAQGGDMHKSQVPALQNVKTSLFDASKEIYYLERRLYIVNRAGYIVPGELEDIQYSLAGSTLRPGGTYFLGEFAFGGKSSAFTAKFLLDVGGSSVQVGGGDIFPSSVNTDLIPLLDRAKATLKGNAGIGIIVSPKFGQAQTNSEDYSVRKVRTALVKVPSHLWHEFHLAIQGIAEDPTSFIIGQLKDIAIQELHEILKDVPEAAAAIGAYQKIKEVVWLSTVANIAANARSEDEIDIASQVIARKLVGTIIQRVLAAAIKVGKAGVKAGIEALRSGKSEGASTASKGDTGTKSGGDTNKPGSKTGDKHEEDTEGDKKAQTNQRQPDKSGTDASKKLEKVENANVPSSEEDTPESTEPNLIVSPPPETGGKPLTVGPGRTLPGNVPASSLRGSIPLPRGAAIGVRPGDLLSGGKIKLSELMDIVPRGTPNTFKSTGRLANGFKYQFVVKGIRYEMKFHEPDPGAPSGSNSASGWSAQIKVGNQFLQQDGTFSANNKTNPAHIPLEL